MVDDIEGCDFWLPPQFLNDDDDFGGNKDTHLFSGTNSEMGSPADSESDEEEDITGFTRKIAHSTLQQNKDSYQNKKGLRLSSSPKSPLCKASGEFSRRKMVEESKGISGMEQPAPNLGFPTNPPPQLTYQQLQAVRHLQFQEFRRQQMMNQGHQNGERMPMGWPSLQRPQHGTGMRAVFLGTNPGAAKKHCAGTGVFLPRTLPSTGNRKNKPACSPVLIPERVVQALNLNMKTLGAQNEAHHRPGYYNHTGVSADYGVGLKFDNENKNHAVEQRQSNAKAEPENQEVIRLPPEWIY